MKKRGAKLLLGLMVLVLSTALSACSGGKEDNSSTEDNSSSQTSGGSVVVGITQDLDSLDPHNVAYAGTREVLFNLFEGLVKAESNGDLVPAVASDYDISDDAKVYTFTLREGIKFHDGSLVTVDDIKYSIERYADIQDEESAFSNLEKVVIKDENTVEIQLIQGNSEFLAELTCAIIPKANEANVATNPIGTGPFKYASFSAGQKLVVEKNEDYWKKGYPFLDEVEFKIIADTDSAMLELEAGSIDIYQYLTVDQANTLSNKFNILEGSVNYVQGLFLNNKFEPFTNVKVRQALYYAIDRDAINEFIFAGKSHIIGTNMIPAFTKYYESSTEKTYEVNIEKAKQLLKEAGYENGFTFTITVPNNYAPHEGAAQIIEQSLKEIGITVKIELVEFTTWYSDVYLARNYEGTVVAVDGTLAPSSWFAKNLSTAANNFTNYSNADFDSLYQQALNTTNDEEKVNLYKQLQEILSEDAASIYIQDPANLVAVNKDLSGYEFYPIAAQDMSIVYFNK